MNKRIPIIIGICIIVISVWMQVTNVEYVRMLIVSLDNLAYDMQLRTRLFTHKNKSAFNIVIIDIDNKSLLQEGRWPWPRAVLGKLLDRLYEEGVVVVAIDMMFSEKETNAATIVANELTKRNLETPLADSLLQKIHPYLNNDLIFADDLKGKDVVLGMTFLSTDETTGLLPAPVLQLSPPQRFLNLFNARGYLSNIPLLQAAARSGGFINVFADPDGIIRRVPIIIRYKDAVYPSLAFAAVRNYLFGQVNLKTALYDNSLQLEAVKLGEHVIPTDSFGQALIPFIGKSFTFPYYSAADILNKKHLNNALAGKIAFIGTSAAGLGDLTASAIQGAYPGVEIQASVAQGILNHSFSNRPAWAIGAEIFLEMVLGLILAFFFPFCGPRTISLLMILIPIVLVFLNDWVWVKTGLILFILIPVLLTLILALLNMIYGYVFETRKRERIKNIFGQYVPERHIDEMLKSSGNLNLDGENRIMTVLFADIRNFTSLSESMTAAEVKDLLNEFFTPMTEIIFKYNGTIDKYIGDLIMAFWGAPLKDSYHTQHAISAALEMEQTAAVINPLFIKRGWPEIKIGIGINSGLMSVGDMGSKYRRNYTVLGDAVNLASRVEGLTKYYGVKIIVTESSCVEQSKFLFRQLDRVRVKGKNVGINIFEVICLSIDATSILLAEIKQSDEALQDYFNQRWNEAVNKFSELQKVYPDTKLYKIYLSRISEFNQSPPAADWDGVYAHA